MTDIESILRDLARGGNPKLPDGTTNVSVNGGHVTIYSDGGAVSADVDAAGNVANLHGHLYGKAGSRDRLDLTREDLGSDGYSGDRYGGDGSFGSSRANQRGRFER